ncbi:MAG: DUF92 domain-containing protein [Methanomicrobiales archaeon]|nr:DUF92 domain-containing protein [Methanomicrobiales archaeon]
MPDDVGIGVAIALTAAGIVVAPYIQPPWVLTILTLLLSGVLFTIKKTRYMAIAIAAIGVLYGLALLSLFVFAATLAIVVGGEFAFRQGEGPRSYLMYSIGAAVAGLGVMGYLGTGSPLVISIGVLVAAMLKSALGNRDDSLMVSGLGVAMTMFLFHEIGFRVDTRMLLAAVVIALAFGYFSYRLRAADLSGLFSGALVGIILIVFADVRWFFIMLTFFILGSACTRFRYERKRQMGVAESHGGVRGYFNVFANGLVAVAATVLFGLTQHEMFVALFLGSVTSAAADTVASEIGVVGTTPYLITTFEPVAHGTNGGVTLIGEVAGTCAAGIVAIGAALLGVADPAMALVCTGAGFVGTNVDSIVGATIENRGIIGNAGTNLIATLCGGLFALFFFIA